MTALDFIALIFAASGLVDVWRNGSVFAEVRAYMEARSDYDPDDDDEVDAPETAVQPGPWWMRVLNVVCPVWVAEMLSCWFCFSHHTPWVLAMLCYFPALFSPYPWLTFLLKLPVYSLAATRIGTMLNESIFHAASYDRDDTLE